MTQLLSCQDFADEPLSFGVIVGIRANALSIKTNIPGNHHHQANIGTSLRSQIIVTTLDVTRASIVY